MPAEAKLRSATGRDIVVRLGEVERTVVESRKDVLLFPSAAMPAVEIIGRIYADLWIETEVPDVDIVLPRCFWRCSGSDGDAVA